VGGAVAAAAAAAAWPVAWPLAEVALLAAKSGDDIEATVQLKEPIQARRGSARCGWAPLRSSPQRAAGSALEAGVS